MTIPLSRMEETVVQDPRDLTCVRWDSSFSMLANDSDVGLWMHGVAMSSTSRSYVTCGTAAQAGTVVVGRAPTLEVGQLPDEEKAGTLNTVLSILDPEVLESVFRNVLMALVTLAVFLIESWLIRRDKTDGLKATQKAQRTFVSLGKLKGSNYHHVMYVNQPLIKKMWMVSCWRNVWLAMFLAPLGTRKCMSRFECSLLWLSEVSSTAACVSYVFSQEKLQAENFQSGGGLLSDPDVATVVRSGLTGWMLVQPAHLLFGYWFRKANQQNSFNCRKLSALWFLKAGDHGKNAYHLNKLTNQRFGAEMLSVRQSWKAKLKRAVVVLKRRRREFYTLNYGLVADSLKKVRYMNNAACFVYFAGIAFGSVVYTSSLSLNDTALFHYSWILALVFDGVIVSPITSLFAILWYASFWPDELKAQSHALQNARVKQVHSALFSTNSCSTTLCFHDGAGGCKSQVQNCDGQPWG